MRASKFTIAYYLIINYLKEEQKELINKKMYWFFQPIYIEVLNI